MIRRLAFFLFLPAALWAQELNPLRELEVPYADSRILLDGVLSGNEYADALTFELFNEMDPEPNGTPPVLAKTYVYRTEEALIIGFDCPLVDIDHLRANIQPRDNAWGDDFIGITMDLYGDMRNTIFIAANAHGVQIDLRNNNPTIEDESQYDVGYNITYDTFTNIGENGWTMEMRIPFSSLQFENKPIQKWRVGFFREYYVGPQVHRAVSMNRNFDNPCFDCQFNDFLVLENIKGGTRRDLLPYVLGGIPVENGAFGLPMGRIGLSAFYGINSQNSIEAAINPDFSTVESDAAQVSVNSATSLFYPERRPFFNEGADLTATTMNYFYSRTISNPSGMVKYLGQGSKLRTYGLAGYDRSSPYLVPGENRDILGVAGQSFASVVRLSRPRKNGANIGYLSTNRIYMDGGSGHLNAITVRENLSDSWRLTGEYAWSFTAEPETDWVTDGATFGKYTAATDGERFHGFSHATGLQRTSLHWVSDIYYTHVGETFRADMGFLPLNNRNELGAQQRYINRLNGQRVKFYQITTGGRANFTPDGRWKQQQLTLEWNAQFAGNFMLGGGAAHGFIEEFEGAVLDNMSTFTQWSSWSPTQRFKLNLFVNTGEFVAYNTASPRIGSGLNTGVEMNLQLFGNVQANFTGNYSSLWERDGSGMIYEGWIWRSVLRYNPNRFVQARLITQWNQFSGDYLFQPLLQYQPGPFTIYYIGSSTYAAPSQGYNGTQIFAKAQLTLRP